MGVWMPLLRHDLHFMTNFPDVVTERAAVSSTDPILVSGSGSASISPDEDIRPWQTLASSSSSEVPSLPCDPTGKKICKSWRDARNMQTSETDPSRMKLLPGRTLLAIYSPIAMKLVASTLSAERMLETPKLQKITWTQYRKSGLKDSAEDFGPKMQRGFDLQNTNKDIRFLREGSLQEADSAKSGSAPPPVYRYDPVEQTFAVAVHTQKFHNKLTFLSWNPGPQRQSLILALFMSKGFGSVILQAGASKVTGKKNFVNL